MAPRYTTIFFDWGGVIADDPGDDFLGRLLRDCGANDAQVEEIFDNYMKDFMRGTISEVQYWQALRDKYGLTVHESISEQFLEWRGLDANTDILNLVKTLQSQGIKTAILSNVIEPTYKVIDAAGYYNRFDDVIASCKVGYAKPEVEIYQKALDKLAVSPQESIFIDDKQKCLDPAKALGFTTILAQSPKQIIDDIVALVSPNHPLPTHLSPSMV